MLYKQLSLYSIVAHLKSVDGMTPFNVLKLFGVES